MVVPWYQSWSGKFVDKTSAAQWKKCMGDARVITLEDLTAGWGTYTSIRSLRGSEVASQELYDLQGRRLSAPPSKGLYIKGGKKIVVTCH